MQWMNCEKRELLQKVLQGKISILIMQSHRVFIIKAKKKKVLLKVKNLMEENSMSRVANFRVALNDYFKESTIRLIL